MDRHRDPDRSRSLDRDSEGDLLAVTVPVNGEIGEGVRRVMADVLLLADDAGSIDPRLTLDAAFNSLGVDKLDLIEVLVEVEERFDVSIKIEDAERWTHVRDVIHSVETALGYSHG